MPISFFLNLFFNFPTSLHVYSSLFLYCKLRSSTVVIYAFCTPPHLWNCTVNYTLLIFYATPSCYIFLYAFSDTFFLLLYAFTNRNLATTKLNVSTVLCYTFLLCYIFNCTPLYIFILILSPANLIFHVQTVKILLSPWISLLCLNWTLSGNLCPPNLVYFDVHIAGEVFVLDDGGEVDLDLGNYERFLDVTLRRNNNITTGKIYQSVIDRERRGDYLGKTVQGAIHLYSVS